MSKHATARDWGFAAVTTITVLFALAAGGVLGVWLALAALTDDLAVTAWTIGGALIVVGIAVAGWSARGLLCAGRRQ